MDLIGLIYEIFDILTLENKGFFSETLHNNSVNLKNPNSNISLMFKPNQHYLTLLLLYV
jgi:hypothetical protein